MRDKQQKYTYMIKVLNSILGRCDNIENYKQPSRSWTIFSVIARDFEVSLTVTCTCAWQCDRDSEDPTRGLSNAISDSQTSHCKGSSTWKGQD